MNSMIPKDFVCLIWGLTSPATLCRSIWRRCFQFCGTFTRHWDEMISQALPPKETKKAYMQWTVWLISLCLGRLSPSWLFTNIHVRCVEASCSPVYFSKPWWAGVGSQRERKYKLHYGEGQGDALRPPHIPLTQAVVTLNMFYERFSFWKQGKHLATEKFGMYKDFWARLASSMSMF